MISRKGRIRVRGPDPDASGLFLVEIPLDRTPDPKWIELYTHPVEYSLSMHRPRVEGPTIVLRCEEKRIEHDVEWGLKWIEQANRRYQSYLDEEERARREKVAKKAEMDETLRKIDERLAKL